jgi:hypothetical protein
MCPARGANKPRKFRTYTYVLRALGDKVMTSKNTIKELRAMLENAERDCGDIEEELAVVQERAAEARKVVDSIRATIAHAEAVIAAADVDAAPTKSIRNVTYELLDRSGGALQVAELLDFLRERGLTVRGSDPRRNLAAHLSADARFKSLGNGLWDLSNRPVQATRPTLTALPRTGTEDNPHPNGSRPDMYGTGSTAVGSSGSRVRLPIPGEIGRLSSETKRATTGDSDNFEDVPF